MQNIIEGADKDEGIMVRFVGRTAAGADTTIGSIDTATLTVFYTTNE